MMRLTAGSFVAALAVLMVVMTMWPDSDKGPSPQRANAQVSGDERQRDEVKVDALARSEEENNAVAAQQLDKRISSMFEDTPLADVLEFLSKTLDVQFYVDKRALEDVAIDTSASVSLHLEQVRAGMAMELMLEQVGLGYRFRDGIIVITTPEEIETKLDIRIYNCRDLLAFGPPANVAGTSGSLQDPESALESMYRGSGGRGGFSSGPGAIGSSDEGATTGRFDGGGARGGGFGRGGFGGGSGRQGGADREDSGDGSSTEKPSSDDASSNAATDDAPGAGEFGAIVPANVLAQFGVGGSGGFGGQSQNATPGGLGGRFGGSSRRAASGQRDVFAERAEQLMEIITRTVEPDTWDAVGGVGTISEYSGLIVISQTQPTHDQIVRLLDMLRESAAEAIAREKAGGNAAGVSRY